MIRVAVDPKPSRTHRGDVVVFAGEASGSRPPKKEMP
jgi:hypothetical protein